MTKIRKGKFFLLEGAVATLKGGTYQELWIKCITKDGSVRSFAPVKPSGSSGLNGCGKKELTAIAELSEQFELTGLYVPDGYERYELELLPFEFSQRKRPPL